MQFKAIHKQGVKDKCKQEKKRFDSYAFQCFIKCSLISLKIIDSTYNYLNTYIQFVIIFMYINSAYSL